MISLKFFLITMFLFIADWSDVVKFCEKIYRIPQRIPVKVHRNQYLR